MDEEDGLRLLGLLREGHVRTIVGVVKVGTTLCAEFRQLFPAMLIIV
jgi:hypothetical protein